MLMEIRALGKLADRLREECSKVDLERCCQELLPSLEDFVRGSKLWVSVAFDGIEIFFLYTHCLDIVVSWLVLLLLRIPLQLIALATVNISHRES